MASTPEYTRKAVDNYRKKFDVMQLRLPKGTKEIIDSKVGKTNAHGFVVECVLKALETTKETQTEPLVKEVEALPQEKEKEPKKAYKEPTAEEIQALQVLIDEKRAKQKDQENVAEKEQLRQESIVKASLPY